MSDPRNKPVDSTGRSVSLTIGGRRPTRTPFTTVFLSDTAESPVAARDDRSERAPNADAGQRPSGARDTGFDRGYEQGFASGREKGLTQGLDEGHEQGYRAGLEAARQATTRENTAEKAHLDALLAALERPLESLREDLASTVSESAQQVARIIVGAALSIEPELIRHTVAQILDEAATNTRPGARLRLRVAPADREITERLIASRHGEALPVDIIEDSDLSRGDVQANRVHDQGDPANQIEWDARLETRWDTIRQAIETAPNRKYSPNSRRRSATTAGPDSAD